MKKILQNILIFLILLAANNYLLYYYYLEPRIKAGLERNTLLETELHFQQIIEYYTTSVVSVGDQRKRTYGSGFFISQFGHIVTTTSFPSYKKTLTVHYNGEEYIAQVLLYDTKNKIALLKITAENTPKMSLTKYKTLKAGSFTIALGNPAGTGLMIEPGVIRRDFSALSSFVYIETTSMIHNGNNGGPLLDSRGKVIGINLMVLQPTKNPMNMNYAIPVDEIIESVSPVIDINEYI